MIEIFCDKHSTKIDEADFDHSKPHPIYVTTCEKCLQEAREEGREQIVTMVSNIRANRGGK